LEGEGREKGRVGEKGGKGPQVEGKGASHFLLTTLTTGSV